MSGRQELDPANASSGSPGPGASVLSTDEANSINDSLESSIIRLKIITAFKTGDTAQLDQLISDHPRLVKYPHLVLTSVQIASIKTIEWLLNKYSKSADEGIDVNVTDGDGNTPLHLAAIYGRQDVALYLLSLPQINDTLTNRAGRQPVEVAKYPELAEAMQVARAHYVEAVSTQLTTYLHDEDTAKLDALLSNPRASALLDINGQNPDTGSTVLHDFVRARRPKMVEFILSHGGDPFQRDRRGVLPIDLTKDDTIKRLLKTASKDQPVMAVPNSGFVATGRQGATGVGSENAAAGASGAAGATGATGSPVSGRAPPVTAPPGLSGYLKKWTNFTGGYKLRWFVLDNGILSYYKRQDDTDRACRGSINLKQATLHLNSSEKAHFEISMKGSSSKLHLKANHPVETNRWVWALTNAIQYAKDQDRKATRAPSVHRRAPSNPQYVSENALARTTTQSSVGSLVSRKKSTRSVNGDLAVVGGGSAIRDDASAIVVIDKRTGESTNPFVNDMRQDYEGADDDEGLDDSSSVLTSDATPFHNQKNVLEDTMKVELSAISDLVKSLLGGINNGRADSATVQKGLSSVGQGIDALQSVLSQFSSQIETRERYYENKLEQSESKQRLWAQNIRDLEIEHEKIQGELHQALQKRKEAARILRAQKPGASAVAGVGSERDQSLLDVSDSSDDEFFDVDEPTGTAPQVGVAAGGAAGAAGAAGAVATAATAASASGDESNEPTKAKESETGEAETQDTEASAAASEVELTEQQAKMKSLIETQGSFKGYEDLPRERLKMDVDDRPKISLWGVLKSLIGKDMTKMTLPVSFNECTNLLQRSAEDMEYTDILDEAATKTDDAALRLAYVAAFTASSYSSTINRIAKPFNPLLGETFEYCRPDKGYRLFAEQVSHHPPIGAVIAESARWDFFGQSNVKSKFNGRSFDINPTGRWYVVLRPNKEAGVEEELYSFRKVTSSVVGIITGSPVVDNYGDMEIVNHTLGYKCILKFKARGWRGSSAYEVKGSVVNSGGKAEYIVGGRWNDRIFARKVIDGDDGDGASVQTPEGETAPSLGSGADSAASPPNKRILLWQVHDRPAAPFNLTQFAITLNALPDNLKKWVAPTDTRLRPDQRAMEEGRYDDASEEKHRVEQKQRVARKQREEAQETYKPKWFNEGKHPVTGDLYFEPKGTYWPTRLEGKLKEVSMDIF